MANDFICFFILKLNTSMENLIPYMIFLLENIFIGGNHNVTQNQPNSPAKTIKDIQCLNIRTGFEIICEEEEE